MVRVRAAGPGDGALLHRFVSELAAYEREPDAVEGTPADYEAQLRTDRPPFECLIAELDGEPVAFALFFQSYSTWKARPGLWLEDLFVVPEARGKGVARALFAALGRIARDRGYGRLDFNVLDWNELALGLYRRLGAEPLADWTVHRIHGPALEAL